MLSELERKFIAAEERICCRICYQRLKECVCPSCPKCGQVSEWKCYIDHGLVSHEVLVARVRNRISTIQLELELEEMFLSDVLETKRPYRGE